VLRKIYIDFVLRINIYCTFASLKIKLFMKNLFRVLVLVLAVGTASLTSSCSDDDKDPPVITFPSNGNQYEVTVGENFNFTFNVVAEGGYATHIMSSTKNNGVITGDLSAIEDGATEFQISGNYAAGDISGPDGIKLTVVDNEGAESSATINVDIISAP